MKRPSADDLAEKKSLLGVGVVKWNSNAKRNRQRLLGRNVREHPLGSGRIRRETKNSHSAGQEASATKERVVLPI